MMKIKLSQNKEAIVDDTDYGELSKYRWVLTQGKYACRYWYPNGETKCMNMHRQIMNAKNGQEVDHINHNTLDNRRSNLRIVNKSKNMMNMMPHRDGSSKFKGVSWNKTNRKWVSNIYIKGKQRYLGSFNDEISAAKKYNEMANKYFSQYALLNPV